jgi:hypothetical protein
VTRAAIAWRVAAGVALAAVVGTLVVALQSGWMGGRTASRSTPSVVLAVRELSRLESASYHMEKVIELTDQQSRLFGLVAAKDGILLVAVGDVVAGVDLSKMTDADVQVDATSGGVRVRLPAVEVLSSSLDEAHTHVYERTTDVLAARNEQLEGMARQEAEKQMRQGAIDAGILTHARARAERTVRGLLRALGFEKIDIDWSR